LYLALHILLSHFTMLLMVIPKSRYCPCYPFNLFLLVILQVAGISNCSKATTLPKADSLIEVYSRSNGDSLKAESFCRLIMYLDSTNQIDLPEYMQFRNLDPLSEWVQSTLQANRIATKLDRMGVNNRNNGKYLLAIRFHEAALDLAKKANDRIKESIILNNIGVIHRRLDNYKNAMDFHMRALNLAEMNHDSITMAIAINSMGNIQESIGNLEEATKLFKKSYTIEKNLNNRLGIAINLNNLGNIYLEQGNLALAKESYLRSLEVNKQINNLKGVAICYNDLGNLYQEEGDFNKALEYFKSAFAINSGLKDKNFLAYSYIKLGGLYTEMHQDKLALEYLIPGLTLSQEINAKNNMVEAYTSLYKMEVNQNRYKKALDYLQLAHQYHDSILNINIRKEIALLQISFESERQANRIQSLEQQAAIAQLKIKRQKTINLLFIIAFILALIMVAFLLFYVYSKNKTNQLLIEKNKIIEKAGIELDRYAQQMLAAKKEAEKISRSKSEFLANMSHEIRTPLNSVIGFSELLSQNITNTKHLNYLKLISSSGKSLLMLINDILDLSKIEAEKLDLHYAPVNIKAIIGEIEQIFSNNIIEKGLELTSHVSSSFPALILFSDIRFRQILFNLVGNAIKFTPKGKIELLVDCHFNEKTGKLNMILFVKDTGIGIEKDNLMSIFEPFRQGGIMKNEQGIGLGLTITKRLVEMMDGIISVESVPGTGTIFSVYFNNIEVINHSAEVLKFTTEIEYQPKTGISVPRFFTEEQLYNHNMQFIKKNQQIIRHKFLPAINTKLISHIQEFCRELNHLADEFNDAGMKEYCTQLEARTTEFDTNAIDMLLNIYEYQFVTNNLNKKQQRGD